jgi:hypothetical protein
MKKLIDNFEEDIRLWSESEAGEKYFMKIKFEADLKKKNVAKLKTLYHDQESFDDLVHKIINKHDEKWDDFCYSKGFEPYPKPLMYALFDLATEDGQKIDGFNVLTNSFPSTIHEYMGWQFAMIFGQGTVFTIYKNLKQIY